MQRFYLPSGATRSNALELTDREARHAIQVLRIRKADRITILNGQGEELLCEVSHVHTRTVDLTVLHRHAVQPLPYQITLIQAIPKGKAMEIIVQKATELGASRIIPLLSERSEVHLKREDALERREKWENTVIEAMKQCGAAWMPQVETPISPKEYLARGDKYDLSLLASLQSERRHPRQVFRDFYEERKLAPKTLAVWVGPEGDFTPAEINAIRSAGSLPVTLGPLILRSETAAIYCLSVLSYELQAGVSSPAW